ncbi:MAG: glutamyl-tRNA reductase [Actinomycetota bacterium]|nr:glutamyl-tRNA reductase [Actinomycetota bacterium]
MIVALSAGRDAPAELRNRVALDEPGQRKLLTSPRPGVAELAVLSTCHRTELYATGDGLDSDIVHAVAAVMPGLTAADQHDLRFMHGVEAVEHLFRVACGLDSLVLGEPQVLGQVRRALALAEETGAAGPVLSNIFGRAIRLGRRVRTQTSLGRLGESIGSVAADYLAHRLEGLSDKRILIVGAGEVASDAATSCVKQSAQVTIISRTLASAQQLGDDVGADVRPLGEIKEGLEESDSAIVGIAGGLIVRQADFPPADQRRPFLILDLSVPRAVELSEGPEIEIRSLEEIPGPRGPEITEAVIDAEALVRKEVADLQHWADTRESGPVIQQLRSFAEEIVRAEVARTLTGLDLTPEQAERIHTLGLRIVNKLLHGPTIELRRSSEVERANIRRIFHLEG